MKLLIDECLSNELTAMARAVYPESTSVIYRGLTGIKDWNLMSILVAEDYTLVTRNSVDFRGRADTPGSKGLYKNVEIHAGLICLNGPVGMDLDMQKDLFAIALEELAGPIGDLVNKCLEVTLDGADRVRIAVYDLPAG